MPTEAEIYEILSGIFRDVFLRDDLTLRPDLSAKDVRGWDSFKQIEIIIAAEQRFAIRLTTREMDGLQNVDDLARVIASKIGV
jgi:acyl carrier protein